MGKRRRTEISKIDCPKARNVCFTKRRQGLFKKAAELSRLHSHLHIAALVFSPAGTPFDFGNTSLFCNQINGSAIKNQSDRPDISKMTLSELQDCSNWSGMKNQLENSDVSKMTLSELQAYSSNLRELRSRLLVSLELGERRVVSNDEIQSDDGIELGVGDLDYLSKFLEEDIIDDDVVVQFQMEELKSDDNNSSINEFIQSGDDGVESDDCFDGLSADEFLNEMLSVG